MHVPLPRLEDPLDGTVDTLFVGDPGAAEGGLADVADDGGGDVLVGGIPPGGAESGLAEAGVLEGQPEGLELRAGQLARTLGDDGEGRQLVEVLADEALDRLDIVLGALSFLSFGVDTVAANDLGDLVGVLADVDAVAAGDATIEERGQLGVCGEDLGDLGGVA